MLTLPVMILLPLICSLVIAAAPARRTFTVAMAGSMFNVLLALQLVGQFAFDRSAEYQFARSIELIPDLGVSLSLGIDSVSLWLIVLTAVLQPLCVWGSKTAITDRVKTYYSWLMALQAAMIGVFAARDILFFYVCFEFTLVPMYVLISLYGSTNRKAAATKFFLYTFTGSIIALAGLVFVASKAAAANAGVWTFDIAALEQASRLMTPGQQAMVLLALMCGFAVKVPLFPVHTWLPLAHTEAPTAGSVILAGVLLKLGTYAIFRFVVPFVPVAVIEYGPFIAGLCIVGILYGGLVCWVQRDVKKLVAYSSVAHLGFCMLGMFALNSVGAAGSVLYMINHGLSTGALFFCIGFMYERYHTRSMEEVGGLWSKMPVWSFFMVFFVMASVGLPGLNGFVSEFMCLLGAFQSGAWSVGPGATDGPLGPWYAAIAGVGMIIAAMYLLIMVGKVVWGPLREPAGHASHDHNGKDHAASAHDEHRLPTDLSGREVAILSVLAVGCVWLGVFPTPLIRTLEAPIERSLAAVETVRLAERQLAEAPPAAPAESQPNLAEVRP